MSRKGHRSGDMYSGKHTTTIPTVHQLCGFLEELNQVTKLSLGFITPLNGSRRTAHVVVKILDESGAILLKVIEKSATQELRCYTSDDQSVG